MYSGTLHYVGSFNESLPRNQNRQNQTVVDQLVKFQWNLAESHVLTLSILNNNEFDGNLGLSTLRPEEATTNLLRRGTTVALSNRNIMHDVLLETTVQWTHRRQTNLAKGDSELIVTPSGWTGNYYTDQIGHDDRLHYGQTAAWEMKMGSIVHRFKIGGEYDFVDSDLQLTRRPYEILNNANGLELTVQYAGPDTAQVHNQQLGTFAQDRIVFNRSTQVEIGLRVDRETVTGKLNPGPRISASYFPFTNDHTKFSGGIGVFYDDIPLQDLQLAQMQRRISTSYLSGGIPDQTLGATSIGVSPNLISPYGVHWNAQWEQEWAPRWVSRVNFVEKKGHDEIRVGSLPLTGGNYELLFNNSGESLYKAVELSLDRPIRNDIRIVTSYIYSESLARPSISLDFPDPAVDAVGLVDTDWNARNRLISWGYFPFFFHTNAAYAVESRSGFPYSVMDELGRLEGGYNTERYPAFFTMNASVEKEIPAPRGKRLALRLGVVNLMNRFNPTFVDNDIDSPTFGSFSNSSGRNFIGRLRILQKP
jgi:outer membrane receptor for ferrienterochelin and colicin